LPYLALPYLQRVHHPALHEALHTGTNIAHLLLFMPFPPLALQQESSQLYCIHAQSHFVFASFIGQCSVNRRARLFRGRKFGALILVQARIPASIHIHNTRTHAHAHGERARERQSKRRKSRASEKEYINCVLLNPWPFGSCDKNKNYLCIIQIIGESLTCAVFFFYF